MTATTSELTGTGSLTRFVLRRDRVRIAVWIVAIVLWCGFSLWLFRGRKSGGDTTE